MLSNSAPLGGILSLCETPRRAYELENVTGASISILTSGKWVKLQFCRSFLFNDQSSTAHTAPLPDRITLFLRYRATCGSQECLKVKWEPVPSVIKLLSCGTTSQSQSGGQTHSLSLGDIVRAGLGRKPPAPLPELFCYEFRLPMDLPSCNELLSLPLVTNAWYGNDMSFSHLVPMDSSLDLSLNIHRCCY